MATNLDAFAAAVGEDVGTLFDESATTRDLLRLIALQNVLLIKASAKLLTTHETCVGELLLDEAIEIINGA